MATVGGELVVTMTVTDNVVVLAPRLSEATAVSVYETTHKFSERLKGLADTLPREVAPSKNWTLVMLPSLSVAAARMVMVAGAIKVAPLVGLLMATVGAKLVAPMTVTGNVIVLAPRLSEATAVS